MSNRHNLKTPISFIILCLALITQAACGQAEQAAASRTPTISLIDCQLTSPGLPDRLSAQCGTLDVFEDPITAAGRKISLNIAVIPAVSRNPAPDPLFFLTGGPGQAATESYLILSSAFARINQKRDIILVDQRGTGKSNPLNCVDLETAELEDETLDDDPGPYLKSCLESLKAQPELYTTSNAVLDLDQVREALGYSNINLYGVSYGTRVALTYLQAFPERVRAVILDGVVPQDETLGLEAAQDAQRALDLIFDRCEAEIGCRQAFPRVRQEFQSLLEKLEQSPVQVTVTDPISGEATEVTLTDEKVVSAVRLLTYTPETVSLLPLIIHSASSGDDFALLASQYLIVSTELAESISEGMYFSVVCTEDAPFFSEEEATRENRGAYIKNLLTEQLFETCKIWPRGQILANRMEPVRANQPVLILSGEADPVTPPENGERVARTLTNSLHLVAPGQGHNIVYRGCIPRLAVEFIDEGSIQDLRSDCVNNIQAMSFFVNFSGPVP